MRSAVTNLLEVAVGLVGTLGRVVRFDRWDCAASGVGVVNGFACGRHLGDVEAMDKSTKASEHD